MTPFTDVIPTPNCRRLALFARNRHCIYRIAAGSGLGDHSTRRFSTRFAVAGGDKTQHPLGIQCYMCRNYRRNMS